jgi:hypothetical protein
MLSEDSTDQCFTTAAICSALIMCHKATECFKSQHIIADELQNRSAEHLDSLTAFRFVESVTGNGFVASLLGLDKNPIKNSISAMIFNLIENFEHWKKAQDQPERIYFYLNWWLRGLNPPPRCAATLAGLGEQCLEEADCILSPYCQSLHCCKSTAATTPCQNERVTPVVPLCAEHVCKYRPDNPALEACKHERIPGAELCKLHVCVGCLLNKVAVCKMREPKACPDHKCSLPECQRLQMFEQIFCAEHVCEQCVVTSYANVRPHSGNSSFCDSHRCSIARCTFKKYNEETPFCNFHLCRVCAKDDVANGVSLAVVDSQLCDHHRCSYDLLDCQHERADSSAFCTNHSCKECVRSKASPVGAATDRPPRNSCVKHPLCEFETDEKKVCHSVKSKKTDLYCVNHLEPKKNKPLTDEKNPVNKCSGVNSKGKPCKTQELIKTLGSNSYCKAHVPKEGQVTPDNPNKAKGYEVEYNENQEENTRKLPLKPVMEMPKVKELFKKIVCSYCSVSKIQSVDNKSAWLCPIHVERAKIEKTEPASSKEEETDSMSTEKASLAAKSSLASFAVIEDKKQVEEKPQENKQQFRKFKIALIINNKYSA